MVFKHTFIMTILIAITALYYPKRSFLVNGSNLISSSDISVFTVTINNSTKDLFEFMDEGLKYINKTNTKKNAVMVLGYSGTGKSTLVNYLNNIPLVSMKQKGVYIVDLKYPNVTLSECFAFGHKTSTKTLYPCFYSPANEDFSYIDNPDFLDTRSLSIEISNGYFRKNILNNVENIKFLLLITHQNLQASGVQFRNTIKFFSDLIGIFDNSDVDIKNLIKSTGLIVTRVNNDGETDDVMTSVFKEQLIEILDEETSKGGLSQRQDMVFRQVIENNQIKIFSNPSKRGLDLDTKQKHDMLDLIENLDYVKKDDAKVRTQIQDTYFGQLNYYTTIKYNIFKKNVSDLIQTSIKNYFEKMTSTINDVNDLKQVYIWLEEIELKKNSTILNIFYYDLIGDKDKMHLIRMENYLKFFIGLLPTFDLDQKWYNVDIKDQVGGFLKKLEGKFWDKVEEFDKTWRMFFNRCLTRYFSNAISNMENSIDSYISIFNQLNATENIFNAKKEITFVLDYVKENLEPNKTFINELKQQIISYNFFLNLVENTSRNGTFFTKKWTDINIQDKLDYFNNELVNQFEKSHKSFIHLIHNEFKDKIFEFYQAAVLRSVSSFGLCNFKLLVEYFKSNFIDWNSSNLSFITSKLANYRMISYLTKNKLDDIYFDQMKFINLLQKSPRTSLNKKFNSLDSLNSFVVRELDNILKEIQRLDEYLATFDNGIFTFKGHFSDISLIIDLIKKNDKIKDLKTIKIYNTHALVFDVDVQIDVDKYRTHAPDLIVFSPRVTFEKEEVMVDLTCQRTPGYPDNQEKAKDGYGDGADGMDGKPGLPGYNGGNFVIVADEIYDSKNLIFISNGGPGGPGQRGII
jgi:energy-coupling factor transporter ATP-binding protein EcfA2